LTQKNKQSLAIEPNQVRILKSFPFVNVECEYTRMIHIAMTGLPLRT
jgi:hypothetical protein